MEKIQKQKTGQRILYITPLLKDIIEPRVNKDNPESLIFSNNGKIISVSTLNTHFKKVCKNARNTFNNIPKEKA